MELTLAWLQVLLGDVLRGLDDEVVLVLGHLLDLINGLLNQIDLLVQLLCHVEDLRIVLNAA